MRMRQLIISTAQFFAKALDAEQSLSQTGMTFDQFLNAAGAHDQAIVEKVDIGHLFHDVFDFA